ncbi:MAG: hypothetical protein LUE21_01515 [Oscillospiraceae bacterium]|nr:hypothetical protein [Oscillospiraceae bacterium]
MQTYKRKWTQLLALLLVIALSLTLIALPAAADETESGETVTSAADSDGHTYDEGVIIKEATETTVGVKLYTCTDCGDTYYEAIMPTGTGAGSSTVSASAAQAAYEAILEEYIAALDDDKDRTGFEDDYPHVSYNEMIIYADNPNDILYAFYDVDGNGQDELLIGLSIFTFDGTEAVSALPEVSYISNSSIYENGTITVWERGSVSSGSWSFYSILADGYTLSLNDSYYYEYSYDGTEVSYTDGTITLPQEGFDVVFAAYTGDSAEASDIQWYDLSDYTPSSDDDDNSDDDIDVTISAISVGKYDEAENAFIYDYDALYAGDMISLEVEVTVDADTTLEFSESDWSCSDESAVVFEAFSKVGPNVSENDNTKQVYYVSMQAELAASGLYTVTFTLSADESRVLSLDLTVFSSQDELQQEYISEHLDYYLNGSYTTDIVSMPYTQGLGFMLEDAADDLSDSLYEIFTVFTSITDIGNYVEVEVEGIENLELSVDCEPIDSVTGYSVIIYQLMANDEVYNGIQDTFSLSLQKNILSIAKLLFSNAEDLLKDDLNEDTVAAAKESFETALDALAKMDSESDGFQEAWLDVTDLCNEYMDSAAMLSIFESEFDMTDALSTVASTLLKEIQTAGEAYQFLCWAETYAETCDAFKTILEDLRDEAYSRAQLELVTSKEDVFLYGSDGYHYRNISNAIDEWLEKMDAYEEAAFEAFVDQIINGTATTIVEVGVNGLVKIGTSLIPYLGTLNKALKVGKLGIDLFTTIDDEYKASFTVTCLSYMVKLLIDVSDNYGMKLLTYDFEDAILFDESINMYKNAMLLACEYGIKYEELKLASVSKGLDDEKYAPLLVDTLWYNNASQRKASKYSLAISLLSLQKAEISDIHCHEDGLTYNNSTGLVEYEDSVRVISIFCPVDVTVYDENGTRLAYLTNDSVEIASGYEHYFYTVPVDDEGSDYIKVAVVPDGEEYEILLNGTDEGTMSVYVGRYDGEVISEEEVYANFPITVNTEGYIDTGDEDNSLGYLVLDGTVYGDTDEVQPSDHHDEISTTTPLPTNAADDETIDNTTVIDSLTPTSGADEDGSVPDTGDEANLALWLVLALACAGGMAGVALTAKKRRAGNK